MAAIPMFEHRDEGLEEDPPPENSMERTGRNSGFSAEPTGLPSEDAGNWRGLLECGVDLGLEVQVKLPLTARTWWHANHETR